MVSLMGDSDLNPAPDSSALAKRLSAFREQHADRIEAYCRVACSADRIDEATEAAFVDFVGRVSEQRVADDGLEATLARAVRSAAAPRIPIEGGHRDCAAVPELLAARANGELPGSDQFLREHLRDCPVCQGTRTRFDRAERVVASLVAKPAPPAPARPAPAETSPPPPAPIIVRRRSGGLVGAVRKRIRPPLS